MSTLTHTLHLENLIPANVAKAAHNLRNAIMRRHLFRVSVAELSQLSGRELADIGVGRSEIKHIAWTEACRVYPRD
ncbi:MAG: DUF1127 domain-containing protein [Brevirhabdus sp.]